MKDDFDQAWDILAEAGLCDGHGGTEYERVRREWESIGCPKTGIRALIVVRANIPPVGEGLESLN